MHLHAFYWPTLRASQLTLRQVQPLCQTALCRFAGLPATAPLLCQWADSFQGTEATCTVCTTVTTAAEGHCGECRTSLTAGDCDRVRGWKWYWGWPHRTGGQLWELKGDLHMWSMHVRVGLHEEWEYATTWSSNTSQVVASAISTPSRSFTSFWPFYPFLLFLHSFAICQC